MNLTCCSKFTLFSQITLNKWWKPASWLCTFSYSKLKLTRRWQSDKIWYPWILDWIGYTRFLLLFVTLPDQFWLLFWKFIWVNKQIHILIKVQVNSMIVCNFAFLFNCTLIGWISFLLLQYSVMCSVESLSLFYLLFNLIYMYYM